MTRPIDPRKCAPIQEGLCAASASDLGTIFGVGDLDGAAGGAAEVPHGEDLCAKKGLRNGCGEGGRAMNGAPHRSARRGGEAIIGARVAACGANCCRGPACVSTGVAAKQTESRPLK